ncbi:M48 family metallopeptidase [Saprospira grandis]|uniref:Zinc metalloprotease n=1 Tax=Saprospira grandis (strain Lewin) TaxID=984262 RepID=H6L677_SAPGL|nr:M48 family metallopeptidase [Saprospira grandis]AFC22978.1 zinc metalloprotease [Saprospira grandis str. Lewin]
MQKMQFWALLLFLLIGQKGWAQDFDDYRCLSASGEVPERFLLSSAQKYELGLAQLDPGLSNKDRKTQAKFQQQTIYSIDDLLRSGKVLFGTPVNDYVNKVGNRLLEHTPELKGKVDFFVIRSSAVNAFATATGVVCVNMGLLAQLENEAQLAFVLSHELMHVQKQHSLSQYEKDLAILKESKQRSLFKKTDFNSALLESNSYSRELEFEADKGGLDIFLKTQYSTAALKSAFSLLNYAYLLYDTTAFDLQYFNEGSCQLDPSIFLPEDSLNAISAWVDDSENTDTLRSTHPSTLRRWEVVEEAISGKTTGDQFFIEPKAEFERIRKIARFELASYYLHNFRFEDALYVVQLLRKEEPNSRYLREVEVQALHAISRFSMYEASSFMNSDYRRQLKTYSKIEGGQQQLYFMSSNLRAVELASLTLYKAWKLQRDYPEDKYFENYYRDAIYVLQQHVPSFDQLPEAMTAAEIKAYLAKAPAEQEYAVAKVTKDSLPKALQDVKLKTLFNSYRKSYGYSDLNKGYNIARYLLSDLLVDEAFKTDYEQVEDYHQQLMQKDSIDQAQARKADKKAKAPGLGIDSVLYVNPYLLAVKKAPKFLGETETSLDFEKRDEILTKFYGEVNKAAEKEGLHVQTLDNRNVEELDAERYAEVATIKDWLRFRMNLDSRHHPIFNQREVDRICKKYGTPYIVTGGYIQQGYNRKINTPIQIAVAAGAVSFIAGAIMLNAEMSKEEDRSFGLSYALLIAGGAAIGVASYVNADLKLGVVSEQLYFSSIFNTANSTYETIGFYNKIGIPKLGSLPRRIKSQIRKDIKRIKKQD